MVQYDYALTILIIMVENRIFCGKTKNLKGQKASLGNNKLILRLRQFIMTSIRI